MDRRIVPVNFDKDKELFDYVLSKPNRSEFIRDCIRKEMYRTIGDKKESIEDTIEKVVKKCLKEYSPNLNKSSIQEQSKEMIEAVKFFDED